MNIGGVSSGRFSFSSQSLKNTSGSSSDNSEELRKQLTGTTKSNSNTANPQAGRTAGPPPGGPPPGGPPPGGPPPGGPPPGGISGGPPQELSKSDLEKLKEMAFQTDGASAKKIDDLIQTFDQYDNGTGKISMDQFKSYAQQNGISLPKPRPPEEYRGDISQAAGGETIERSVVKNSVARLLSKYAPNSSPPSGGSSNASSPSTDYSTMTPAQLQKLAASGDPKASAEVEKRKSSSSNGQASVAVSAGVNIAA